MLRLIKHRCKATILDLVRQLYRGAFNTWVPEQEGRIEKEVIFQTSLILTVN